MFDSVLAMWCSYPDTFLRSNLFQVPWKFLKNVCVSLLLNSVCTGIGLLYVHILTLWASVCLFCLNWLYFKDLHLFINFRTIVLKMHLIKCFLGENKQYIIYTNNVHHEGKEYHQMITRWKNRHELLLQDFLMKMFLKMNKDVSQSKLSFTINNFVLDRVIMTWTLKKLKTMVTLLAGCVLEWYKKEKKQESRTQFGKQCQVKRIESTLIFWLENDCAQNLVYYVETISKKEGVPAEWE